MKLPRDLNGQRVAQGLCRDWGYRLVHQQGSHIILQTEQPHHHRLAIPNHSALRIGTLNSLLRAVSQLKGVDRVTLLKSFE